MTRKVKVFHMVQTNKGEPGRAIYAKEEKCVAMFHQFGSDYEEFETGAGNYSTAIIEYIGGTVEMVRADFIQFIDQDAK